MSNADLLAKLVQKGAIDSRRASIYDEVPEPLAVSVDFNRVEGMMLGLAVGDALGNTSESMTPARRRSRYGEIRDYLPSRDGSPRGLPSDDTQLAFWTLDQMNRDRRFDPERVAERFASEYIFGIGGSVKKFLRAFKRGDRPWYECASRSAGNGALMRIAPMLIPHARTGGPDLWVDTTLSAAITHNDSAAIASCVGFIAILWDLLSMGTVPSPQWWVERFVEVAGCVETDRAYTSRSPLFQEFSGTLSQFVAENVPAALGSGLSVVEACDRWYSAAYVLETVPCALYILMKHSHDPEEAIVRAVNDTWDNDTVAAIVGAAVGALHGRSALPERWLSGLSGRTGNEDDGRVWRILDDTQRIWFDRAEPASHTDGAPS